MPVIHLTDQPLDYTAITESVRDPAAGAVVLFLGTVREFTAGQQTEHLEYEAYREMAESSLKQLADEASARFPIVKTAIVHRLGALQLSDVAVAIAVSTPHRAQAFAAGQWLIDTLKQRVPIWKREHYTDGRVLWQHPAAVADSAAGQSGGT
ncbi:MAG: molybdenum cofactor biosynthesis protein MoaE [Planctomyces sp.]